MPPHLTRQGPSIPRDGRPTLLRTGIAVVLLLAAVNIVLSFGPVGIGPVGVGLVTGPTLAIVLLVLARRAGLSWDELGLARASWRRGALYALALIGFVAATFGAGLVVPATKQVLTTLIAGLNEDSMLLSILLVVPLGTVIVEEVAFRGVLLGLVRRHTGAVLANLASSLLFAAWHLLPSLRPESNATTVSWQGNPALAVLLPLAFTCFAGLILCEVRRRSRSLLASIGLHWAVNGLGLLLLTVLL